MFVFKKTIEAHAAPGSARRTLSAYALLNCTNPAPFSRRAIPPQRPTNASNKTIRVLLSIFLSPGGSPRVLAGRPPAPCGVAPWLRRAPSAVCGCTITKMGHTHDPYGGVRHLVLCAPGPVGCRPSVSRPPPCAPVRAREPNSARGHRGPKNRC